MLSRIGYYAASIPTMGRQIVNWPVCFKLLARRQSVIIQLKNGCRFKVRSLMDVWVVKETCLDREYEVNAVAIQEGWTVVDIGAGLGDFAILTAYEHARCRVYAYEPFPASYALLEENLRLNGVRGVTPCPVAVGARSGELTLFATGAAAQHTTTEVSKYARDLSFRVPGRSLEDVFAAHDITTCDFLKMDCEGGEFAILFNASAETLQRVRHICLEYHDGFTAFSHRDLVDYLQQRGFQVQIAPNRVYQYLGLLYAYR